MAKDHSCQVDNEALFEDEELFNNDNDQVNDLHTYYMSQFNLELENSKKPEVKINPEQSYDFQNYNNWNANPNGCSNSNVNNLNSDLQIIDEVIENNSINEDNIKDVLFDLDNIEFEGNAVSSSTEANSSVKLDFDCFEPNCDYIDDESLIDELCREDNEPYRLTPDIFNDSYLSALTNDKSLLPPIETAFSKHYNNYTQNDDTAQIKHNIEQTFNNNQVTNAVTSIDNYSYPNNVIYNINNNKQYILPDTPTSCSEFTFDRSQRKVSVSESIESDVYSSSYYEDNSESLDEDELFINLDDLGFNFEKNDDAANNDIKTNYKEKKEKDKSQGERTCLWEHCYERYPNQSTLVEHIERAHVNTYKGDEFSCLWSDCVRARRPFNARYKLLIHMRVHSGHKPNRCHHLGCGKAFSRLENLKIHVRSHTGERPYACPAPHCRKAFSNSSDRAKHQRTHFNARPYACSAIGCGKRYTDPSSLRKHVKTHPHVTNMPKTSMPPVRMFRRSQGAEQTVPSSPAKLTTLRCIRDKLATVSRFQTL